MFHKDVNNKSPLRVFERSIHGGLGRGNIGLVVSRAGEGKTAFLVDIALDDLMRDRKVLHVDTTHTTERLREYYDEIFHDLVETMHIEDHAAMHVRIEQNRMIHTYLHGSFSLDKVDRALDHMREHLGFQPWCVILDGMPPWEDIAPDEILTQLSAIKDFAVRRNVELWLSAQEHREDARDANGLPVRLKPYLDAISVVIELVPAADHMKLRLIKDHENPKVAELHLELDPKTMLIKWE